MKLSSIMSFKATSIIIGLMLVTLLVFQSSCSSTHHAGKGKKGMVPCPCEKKSNRR